MLAIADEPDGGLAQVPDRPLLGLAEFRHGQTGGGPLHIPREVSRESLTPEREEFGALQAGQPPLPPLPPLVTHTADGTHGDVRRLSRR